MDKDTFEKAIELQKKIEVRKKILEKFEETGLINCYIDKNESNYLHHDMLILWDKHIEDLEKEFNEL
jgi:hypothetical protein